jgi:hypothetical protein
MVSPTLSRCFDDIQRYAEDMPRSRISSDDVKQFTAALAGIAEKYSQNESIGIANRNAMLAMELKYASLLESYFGDITPVYDKPISIVKEEINNEIAIFAPLSNFLNGPSDFLDQIPPEDMAKYLKSVYEKGESRATLDYINGY